MKTFDQLSRERDLTAYGVVGCARSVAWMIRETHLTPEDAADLLEGELKRYEDANQALQAHKFDQSIGLDATIESTERVLAAVLEPQFGGMPETRYRELERSHLEQGTGVNDPGWGQ